MWIFFTVALWLSSAVRVRRGFVAVALLGLIALWHVGSVLTRNRYAYFKYVLKAGRIYEYSSYLLKSSCQNANIVNFRQRYIHNPKSNLQRIR